MEPQLGNSALVILVRQQPHSIPIRVIWDKSVNHSI